MTDTWTQRTAAEYAQGFNSLLPRGGAWPRDQESVLQKVVWGLAGIWGDPVEAEAALLLTKESDPRSTVMLLPDWERAWGLPDLCLAEPLTIADRQNALVSRMTMLGGQSRAFFIKLAASIGYVIRITEYAPFMCGVSECGDTTGRAGVIGTSSDTLSFTTGPYGPINVTAGMPLVAGDGVMLVSRSTGANVQGYVTSYSGTQLYFTATSFSGVSSYSDFNLLRIDDYRWEIGPEEMRFYWTVAVDAARLSWFRASSGQAGVDHHLEIGIATDLECLLRRDKPAHTDIVFDYSGLANAGSMAGTP
jgi:uncharacterized protein YmfQ (DUF2313 family)